MSLPSQSRESTMKTQAYSSHVFMFLELTPKFNSSWTLTDVHGSSQHFNWASHCSQTGVGGPFCLDFWTAPPDLNSTLKLGSYNLGPAPLKGDGKQGGGLEFPLISKLFPMIPPQWVPEQIL